MAMPAPSKSPLFMLSTIFLATVGSVVGFKTALLPSSCSMCFCVMSARTVSSEAPISFAVFAENLSSPLSQKGGRRLRFFLSSAHTADQIDRAVTLTAETLADLKAAHGDE